MSIEALKILDWLAAERREQLRAETLWAKEEALRIVLEDIEEKREKWARG